MQCLEVEFVECVVSFEDEDSWSCESDRLVQIVFLWSWTKGYDLVEGCGEDAVVIVEDVWICF
jgi:hypothetical protein